MPPGPVTQPRVKSSQVVVVLVIIVGFQNCDENLNEEESHLDSFADGSEDLHQLAQGITSPANQDLPEQVDRRSYSRNPRGSERKRQVVEEAGRQSGHKAWLAGNPKHGCEDCHGLIEHRIAGPVPQLFHVPLGLTDNGVGLPVLPLRILLGRVARQFLKRRVVRCLTLLPQHLWWL